MPSQKDWDNLNQEYMQEEMKNIKYNKTTARILKIMIAVILVFSIVVIAALGIAVLMIVSSR